LSETLPWEPKLVRNFTLEIETCPKLSEPGVFKFEQQLTPKLVPGLACLGKQTFNPKPFPPSSCRAFFSKVPLAEQIFTMATCAQQSVLAFPVQGTSLLMSVAKIKSVLPEVWSDVPASDNKLFSVVVSV
jgi:hypothetical protein